VTEASAIVFLMKKLFSRSKNLGENVKKVIVAM